MMYITATFQHSIKVEQAITELRQSGIPQTDILAIPIKTNDKKRMLLDTMHDADGKSMFDLPMLGAALFSLFGCVYGFIWRLGPIIWGSIGIVLGFCIGLLIKLLVIKKDKGVKKGNADVVLFIACSKEQSDIVRNLLCNDGALGVGYLDINHAP